MFANVSDLIAREISCVENGLWNSRIALLDIYEGFCTRSVLYLLSSFYVTFANIPKYILYLYIAVLKMQFCFLIYIYILT